MRVFAMRMQMLFGCLAMQLIACKHGALNTTATLDETEAATRAAAAELLGTWDSDCKVADAVGVSTRRVYAEDGRYEQLSIRREANCDGKIIAAFYHAGRLRSYRPETILEGVIDPEIAAMRIEETTRLVLTNVREEGLCSNASREMLQYLEANQIAAKTTDCIESAEEANYRAYRINGKRLAYRFLENCALPTLDSKANAESGVAEMVFGAAKQPCSVFERVSP